VGNGHCIVLVIKRVVGENRKMLVHDLLTDSFEASKIFGQEWASLLVSREFGGQKTLQPVFECSEEDLLADLHNDLIFLTAGRGRGLLLFIVTTDAW